MMESTGHFIRYDRSRAHAEFRSCRAPHVRNLKPSNRIIFEVCRDRGVSIEELLGYRRFRYLAHARWEVMARLQSELKYSLPRIGRILGLDHTSVMYGLRRREEMIAAGEWE